MARATFNAMTEGTAEDWAQIAAANAAFTPGLTDRVMDHLRLLDGDFGGFKVDRLTHSLQTATRAYRADRDDDYVACALLHDIGDTLASFSHPDIGAAIVRPFVDESLHWMVQQHGVFQGYYFFHFLGLDRTLRDQYEGHPHYDLTAEFCADFDQPSFDPDYPTLALDEFEPLLRDFFKAPKRSIYVRSGDS
jgi:predicted HD phosphohydrolase